MEEGPFRKLAVILHADVVGSTALVQANETLAHQRIRDAFRQFSETIAAHGGIPHEIRGDALVAEFPKASDAVGASLDFQEANTSHNESLSDEVCPVIRAGIAMGEVVVADNTVTGEGVVLAQRLEQLATPGGVCIQGAAYETIPKRLRFAYESLGERRLKGFDEPIRVYAVSSRSRADVPESDTRAKWDAAAPNVADKPSIAVLPFTNMSGDLEQEYFSDGITEDIITELSRFRSISVIARTSSFTYKGKAVQIQHVGNELGVAYVLEGSVRKAGSRIRINAQLVDADTGKHVWAERYDRDLSDVFAVQDEVTRAIVAVIAGRVDAAEAQRITWKRPENLTAYDFYLRGLQELNLEDRDTYPKARALFQQAIKADSGYARAYTYVALTYFCDVFYLVTERESLDLALDMVQKALALDPEDTFAHGVQGLILIMLERDDEGIAKLEHSLELNPNDADLLHWTGFMLHLVGRADEGVEYIREAIRLNPFNVNWDNSLAFSLFYAGRFQEAVEEWRKYADTDHRWSIAGLSAAYAHLDLMEEARSMAKRFVNIRESELRSKGEPIPDSKLALWSEENERIYPGRSETMKVLRDGLRKAGLS